MTAQDLGDRTRITAIHSNGKVLFKESPQRETLCSDKFFAGLDPSLQQISITLESDTDQLTACPNFRLPK